MDGELNLDDDIQCMLNTIFEEEELLNKMNENDNSNDLNKNQSDELIMTDKRLDIKSTVDLEPQVFIDNSTLLIITHKYDSNGDEEWDLKQLN